MSTADMQRATIWQLNTEYAPTGDQPTAIAALGAGLLAGHRFQTLEGVTGSGKTFTVANVIADQTRPVLVISHNKTLAAQLYAELKGYFPHNAVEYFVSYYDYYQPEAYLPQTDTFIEKDASINAELERLRLAATDALLNRSDVIIVASVSCIYGLGSPADYREMLIDLAVGQSIPRAELLERLVAIQYTRNDYEKQPGTFSVRGDTIDLAPSYARYVLRLRLFGDEIEAIERLDPLTGRCEARLERVGISPAKHFVMPYRKLEASLAGIRAELEVRLAELVAADKLLEAQRLRMRTEMDLEMMRELGYCSGIENYSRHLAGRPAGAPPETLLDYFPEAFLTVIDESHVTLPQIRGMFNGDQARKRVLVEHGFRLPSALDNRPLRSEEFFERVGPVLFASATPGPVEREWSARIVPQLIRPTGIADPPIEVRPLEGQIDDLIHEVRQRAERHERTLVTTLTKRTAEDLSAYLREAGLRVEYLHSEIDAIERVEVLRRLRQAEFDCLVGINLLREGLDLPEVSLVAILDADKEGFLRSETSLVQTAGRAARHLEGRVILYADRVTDSMRRMLDKTAARRAAQLAYNVEQGITPRGIVKAVQASLIIGQDAREKERQVLREAGQDVSRAELIAEIEREMIEAAEALEYERAALLRDQLSEIKGEPVGDRRTGRRRGAFKYKSKGRRK